MIRDQRKDSLLPSGFHPEFWNLRQLPTESRQHSLNLRRLWKVTVLIMSVVALGPLLVMTAIDYKVTQRSVESEALLRTSRIVSNTKRVIEFSFVERMAALDFIVQDNSFSELQECARLQAILDHLQTSFEGFVDLGVIDATGRQQCYVGPHDLLGVDYSHEEWFRRVVAQGVYVSDVFSGFRHVPHLVIAARHELQDGSFYVLRTSLQAEFFNTLLADLELSGNGDAFIIDHIGNLQTSSRRHGDVLDELHLGVPAFSETTRVYEVEDENGESLVVGYSYIPETPFIVMIVKQKTALMESWRNTRRKLIGFLGTSISAILIAILGVTTYLVNKIHWADRKRVAVLHQIEYTNKMISLGRLGAGIAHEINNPLAIINEKAGLLKDLFTFTERYAHDPKLTGIVDSIISSVERCSAITRRLLNFARDSDSESCVVDLKQVVTEVLGFMGKEAEYRCIEVVVDIEDDVPQIKTNRGRLQQILLNLINNAFAAVEEEGQIEIAVVPTEADRVTIRVSDTGCGMAETELKRIFEPFYTTRTSKEGTGLGLSITYSLAQELGGEISVQSSLGIGTTFLVTLPVEPRQKEDKPHEGLVG